MSKPPESEMSRYARMCGLKKRYATAEDAGRGTNYRVYQCPYCKCFHRTTKRKAQP